MIFLVLQNVRELQSSLREGVQLFHTLLDELARNLESERRGILATQVVESSLRDPFHETKMLLIS